MKRKYTPMILLTLLILTTIGICSGCSGTAAEPPLELVKYQSYSLKDAAWTTTCDDGTKIPISHLSIRNKGEEAICGFTIRQNWLDKDGAEVMTNQFGIAYNDVLLPGQTVRIDITIPTEVDKQTREKINSFSFGEYAGDTVSGSAINGSFTDPPESLPINTTKTFNFAEEKPCKNSPISGKVVLLDDKKALTVKSIKYNVKKHRVKVKLKNKTDKRIDWSNDTPFINFLSLDKDGNICHVSGFAEIKKDGLDPGDSITVKGEYEPSGNAEYVTVTGIQGFTFTPFYAIPKAVTLK